MAGRNITVAGKDGSFGAYMAVPEKGNGATIVVIQEIFGVNKVMRDTADWLAEREKAGA